MTDTEEPDPRDARDDADERTPRDTGAAADQPLPGPPASPDPEDDR